MNKRLDPFSYNTYNKDAVTLMKQFLKVKKTRFDCIYLDFPYNIKYRYENYDDNQKEDKYRHFVTGVLSHAYILLKATGSMFIQNRYEHVPFMMEHLRSKHRVSYQNGSWRNQIIWSYTFGQYCHKKFALCHTPIQWVVKDSGKYHFFPDNVRVPSERQKRGDKRHDPRGKIPIDVWDIPRVCGNFKERCDFPCQTPMEVVERCMLATTKIRGRVFDPMCGSGTVGVVALKHGREVVLNDIDPYAIEVATKRIEGREWV